MIRALVCNIFYSKVLLVMDLRDMKPGVLGTQGISSDITQAAI